MDIYGNKMTPGLSFCFHVIHTLSEVANAKKFSVSMMHNFATSCDSYAYISTLTQRTEEQNQTCWNWYTITTPVLPKCEYIEIIHDNIRIVV